MMKMEFRIGKNGEKMSRLVICAICKKEWELRWGIMANESLARHMKDHK
jgi:hypothetical protein